MSFNNKVFDSFPILKTDRFTLREIRISDGKAIYKMRSNDRVNQFIPRPRMMDEIQGNDLADRTAKAYVNKQGIGWGRHAS